MDVAARDDLARLAALARRAGTEVLAPNAAQVDASEAWPAECVRGPAVVSEELARHCGSTATSGAHADSCVVSFAAVGGENDPGTFSFMAVDGDSDGLHRGEAWTGFGMRGNSSRSLEMADVRVPTDSLLGGTGDPIRYVFEVILPCFLIAMSSVYVGVCAAALDLAIAHLKQRQHSRTGESLRSLPMLWHDVADAWAEVEAARQLLRHAARGYGENSAIARMRRGARAAHVMSPTTHMLEGCLRRSLLGLPPP
ncbi:MAG: acyl-CoA dehydrogenase family protein [Rhodanobacteraceae bacterium]